MSASGIPENIRAALRLALPDLTPGVLKVLDQYGSLVEAPDADAHKLLGTIRAASAVQLAGRLEQSREAAEKALRRLSPAAAFMPAFIEAAWSRPRSAMLREAGMNRFIWSVGVAASGSDDTYSAFCDFLDHASEWFAAKFLFGLLDDANDDLPLGIATSQGLEEIRRLFSTEIRLAWITRLVFDATAECIRDEPQKYSALAWLDGQQTEEYFAEVGAILQGTSENAAPIESLKSRLARSFSVKSGSLSGAGLDSLMLSSQIESNPCVEHEGRIAPLGARQGTFHAEMALFELVRISLPSEKDRGDLFEDVITKCLASVMPEKLRMIASPQSIQKAGSSDPLEVDFGFRGVKLHCIGEAKAYFVARDARTVINAFSDQMGKAVSQLQRRLQAFYEGAPHVSPSEMYTCSPDLRSTGVATPLHSYAGAVWSRDALEEIGALRANIAILPLHQLVMVSQAMINESDFVRYLHYRNRIIAGMEVADEADILIPYLAGDPGGQEARVEAMSSQPDTKVLLQARSLHPEVAWLYPKPSSSNRRSFRHFLRNATEQVQ